MVNFLSKRRKPVPSQNNVVAMTLYSNLPHIVRLLFGTLDAASHWFSQVSASPISSLVMFPEHGEQVSLALPKYPALQTTKRKRDGTCRKQCLVPLPPFLPVSIIEIYGWKSGTKTAVDKYHQRFFEPISESLPSKSIHEFSVWNQCE